MINLKTSLPYVNISKPIKEKAIVLKISNNLISIIVPVNNEEKTLRILFHSIRKVMHSAKYNYEIILIDDGSIDNSWKEIQLLAENNSDNPHVKAISFSRHFGKEAAILAGLAYAKGDAIITMDSDLQHPPEKIKDFINAWTQGAKIVGVKINRGKESVIHAFFAKRFYNLMSLAIGKDFNNMSDYKLIDREVVDVILRLPERQMFYRAITSWIGFKTATVEYEVGERKEGNSKWSMIDLMLYALRNITSFTSAPLQIVSLFAVIFFIFTVFLAIQTLFNWFIGNSLEGFSTVIFLQLIIGDIIMFSLGLIGIYIAKIYNEVSHRPRYVVEDKVNL